MKPDLATGLTVLGIMILLLIGVVVWEQEVRERDPNVRTETFQVADRTMYNFTPNHTRVATVGFNTYVTNETYPFRAYWAVNTSTHNSLRQVQHLNLSRDTGPITVRTEYVPGDDNYLLSPNKSVLLDIEPIPDRDSR